MSMTVPRLFIVSLMSMTVPRLFIPTFVHAWYPLIVLKSVWATSCNRRMSISSLWGNSHQR
jgi:hypothetical protein